MKKIAYIAKNLNVNGISSVILNYVLNLDKEKYFFDIYVGNPISKINIDKLSGRDNIRIIKTPDRKKKNLLNYYKFLMDNIKNYDVVHVHGNSCVVALDLLISKINRNKKNIVHCHNIKCDNNLIHMIIKPFFKLFYDEAVACSKESGLWMYGGKNFTIIPNGIDTNSYKFNIKKRNIIRDKINVKDEIIIGHVGNFSDQKNYPFIIEMFNKICEKSNKYKLLLVGNYDNNKKLYDYIKHSKNSDKIIFYGSTGNISDVYNAMDIFVFPSKFEGLGIVLVEAQCSGLSCFASNRVPIESMVNEDLVSYLDINNVDEWVDNLLKVDQLFREKYFQKYKNQIDMFDLKKSISLLEEIYNK